MPYYMVDRLEDSMRHSDYRLLGTKASFESIVFGSVIRPLLLYGWPGYFDHDSLQTVLSHSAFSAKSLSPALIVPGAQTAPGR